MQARAVLQRGGGSCRRASCAGYCWDVLQMYAGLYLQPCILPEPCMITFLLTWRCAWHGWC